MIFGKTRKNMVNAHRHRIYSNIERLLFVNKSLAQALVTGQHQVSAPMDMATQWQHAAKLSQ